MLYAAGECAMVIRRMPIGIPLPDARVAAGTRRIYAVWMSTRKLLNHAAKSAASVKTFVSAPSLLMPVSYTHLTLPTM